MIFLFEFFKKKNKNYSQKGFTLIELLVVVAIISLLSSVMFASLSSARAKARDARRISDLRQLRLAINLYYDQIGSMPTVYAGGGPEECSASLGVAQYDQTMQDMINARVLSSIPRDPGTQAWARGYCYYNYGAGNTTGAILVTRLETTPLSTTGLSGSCRPFTGTNWCANDSSNSYYCLCNPY